MQVGLNPRLGRSLQPLLQLLDRLLARGAIRGEDLGARLLALQALPGSSTEPIGQKMQRHDVHVTDGSQAREDEQTRAGGVRALVSQAWSEPDNRPESTHGSSSCAKRTLTTAASEVLSS